MARFTEDAIKARLGPLGYFLGDTPEGAERLQDWPAEVDTSVRLWVRKGREPVGVVEVVRSPTGFRVVEALRLSRQAKLAVMDVVGGYFDGVARAG